MAAMEIEVSTPTHAYLAIRRKLLTLRRKKSTAGSIRSERSSKRQREFAPPEVIKRLNADDNVRKEGAGVMPYAHIVENGKAMAVFLMPLHGKASESLNSLLEMFHAGAPHATKKPIVDGPQIPATPDTTQPLESEPTVVPTPTPRPDSPVVQQREAIPRSYSTESSAMTVEEPEQDAEGDIFGQIDFSQTARQKERLTSVSSEISTTSNTTVIWVGSLTPAPIQPESSRMGLQRKRAPSEITVDWQGSGADEQEEDEEEDVEATTGSLMSVSPGSPKSSMHIRTPGRSGMPSPNVEIYSAANTHNEENTNSLPSAPISAATGTRLKKFSVATESQEKRSLSSDMNKVDGRPVVPFYYGSKIPVMAAKTSLSGCNKSSYGSLIAHQRRLSIGEVPSKPPAPKPHSCSATPIVAPKPRVPKRKSSNSSVKSLSRKDVAAGHFPGTPPRATTPSIITTGGSPRPKSSSKIPIPSPTTPRAIEARKPVDILAGFGDNLLSDIVEADCETDGIWEKRRNEVMGPLGVSPTTRLGGFVRPANSLAKASSSRTPALHPMASLVGAAMAPSDMKS